MTEALSCIEKVTGTGDVKATIIILHGLGADGNDFVPFTSELNLTSVGNVRYLFPSAPTRPVTINGGYVMRAWYDILGADLQRREDEAGLRVSQQQITALIDREVARGVPANRIILGGFSQGCAMTFQVGLRYKERLGGLLAMSGYVPLLASLDTERSDANRLTPIFMAHGQADAVITIGRARSSHEALKALSYDVQWHEYPMAHSVAMEEIEDINAWLLKVLD
jgi:phospholipase/carboxylesterase